MLQSCDHWMLLCKQGITPDLARAQPVVDLESDGSTPEFAVFAAIAEIVMAGKTVLVACRAADRLQKVATVTQRLGWQAVLMDDRGDDRGADTGSEATHLNDLHPSIRTPVGARASSSS